MYKGSTKTSEKEDVAGHHCIVQPPPRSWLDPDPRGRALMDTLAASWKTSVTPLLCFALHSEKD